MGRILHGEPSLYDIARFELADLPEGLRLALQRGGFYTRTTIELTNDDLIIGSLVIHHTADGKFSSRSLIGKKRMKEIRKYIPFQGKT